MGFEGARCRKDRDCHIGFCCAKSDGDLVCKRMLQEGDVCDVPEGGLAYALNHSCPCAQGLKCKKVRRKHLGKR